MGASRRLANTAAAGEEGEGTEATTATTVPVDLGTETAAAPPMEGGDGEDHHEGRFVGASAWPAPAE
jgi:hypothetical protein